MGSLKRPLTGILFLALPFAVFVFSCTPKVEKRFSNRLLVEENYGLPAEVLKAELKTSKRGEKSVELLLRNVSDKKLLLECDTYFLTEEGLKVSVPGFGVSLCEIPPKGTKRIKIDLPVVGVGWKTAVVKLRQLQTVGGNTSKREIPIN